MQHTKNTEKFLHLLKRYKKGICSPGEVKELFDLVKCGENNAELDDALRNDFNLIFQTDEQNQFLPIENHNRHLFRKFALAAAATVILIMGLYFFFQTQKKENASRNLVGKNLEINAGKNQTVLTMDDGQQIVLDSNSIGKIGIQSGTIISLNGDGELLYDASLAENDEKIRTNIVSTPTGGFFKIILPDGTNVWLNAESELTFPTKFKGRERNVSLKGEAYFEVAADKEKPFKLTLDGGEEITVLGTIFNAMAYHNEPAPKITLLAGSIKLLHHKNVSILKPGEQAVLKNKKIELNNNPDIDHEIAWKNGLFDFQNNDLPSVMRQISRWYHVDFVYNESIEIGHFTGSIRKSSAITEVLKMLEVAGDVDFSIIGTKIIVHEKK